jgi:hypothetical protein
MIRTSVSNQDTNYSRVGGKGLEADSHGRMRHSQCCCCNFNSNCKLKDYKIFQTLEHTVQYQNIMHGTGGGYLVRLNKSWNKLAPSVFALISTLPIPGFGTFMLVYGYLSIS